MMLYIYAALAYASTPYMTGEHGVNWMTTTALTLRVYASMELCGKRFCCICRDSSEFPSFSCSRSDAYSSVYVCCHYAFTLTRLLRLASLLLRLPRGYRSPKRRAHKRKKSDAPPKRKSEKSVFTSPKDKRKRAISPSALERKDAAKKLSNAHAYESLTVAMRNSLRQESNSIVDVLINDHYKIPESPAEPTNEQVKGHSKLYGDSALSTNVKAIVSAIYAKLRDERQQRVNAEYQAHAWMLIKSVDEVKKLIALIKRAKVEERGAPRSSLLEVRKSRFIRLWLDYCVSLLERGLTLFWP